MKFQLSLNSDSQDANKCRVKVVKVVTTLAVLIYSYNTERIRISF